MNFENDAALGLSATETTRNAAANELYSKSFKDLDEAQKQLTLLQMVEDANKVSGAMGQAARESEGWENVIGNATQAWTDFKAVVGVPFLEVATSGLLTLTDVMQNLDADKIADAFSAGVDYLSETFMPLIDVVMADLRELWAFLGQDSVSGGFQAALQIIQDSMHWLADNWQTVKDGIVALTAGLVAYKAAIAGAFILGKLNTLIRLYNTGMLLTAIQTKATTAATWLFNTALRANPIGLVATAIGLLVGAGVMLYKNWDTVRNKTQELWDKLGAAQGVVTVLLGPLGLIIKAAVNIRENWDSTKSVWENVWGGIVSTTESSVNTIIESINWLIEKINLIPGVNIPIVPKVDWTGVDTAKSSDMVNEMSYAEAVAGSHRNGLASVPYDGYVAELHRGEPVLTAQQGNVLRGMGVLRSVGARPVIDTGPLRQNFRQPVLQRGDQADVRPKVYKPKRQASAVNLSIGRIEVNGHNKPTEEIAKEVTEIMYDELQRRIAGGVLA